MVISVYSPGSEAGVMVPPCSRTMSWHRLRAMPVHFCANTSEEPKETSTV